MARSHHRKKHKEHLQQFKHSHDVTTTSPKVKTKAAWVFAIAGAILVSIVSYLAAGSSLVWMGAGLVAGALAGYWIGNRIDQQKTK